MIVCIAEKPSVARDIASVIGATTQRDGYMEGNGYQVTWTFGHLCTLKEPNDYTDNWKRWSLGSLPMIPQRFGIKLIEDRGIEKQFQVIERLMQNADEIVNCGDAGQEGKPNVLLNGYGFHRLPRKPSDRDLPTLKTKASINRFTSQD